MLCYTTVVRLEKYKYMYDRHVTTARLGETEVPSLYEALLFTLTTAYIGEIETYAESRCEND